MEYVLVAIGLVFVVLGLLVWKKQMIKLLHDYHCDKVSEKDKQAFCALSGQGVVLIGAGIAAAGIVMVLTQSLYSMLFIFAGFAAGLAMLITAGIKYNR